MGTAMKLQEKVTLPRTAWRLADVFILGLLLALLSHRVASLGDQGGAGGTWLAALVCEGWFTLVWILNMNMKWNPVRLHTYPENLPQRMDELPAVDMLVTTADPELEPPLITVNTVLSLLAVDYPDVGKLACYVSDDGCSPVTCYALREAAGFARLWVPFCKRHGVGVRAPFMYFASTPEPVVGTAGDWTFIKSEYDKLVSRIQSADEGSLLRHDDAGEFAEFVGAGRGEHPAIIKVLWDNSKSSGRGQGFPNLVYVSREKSSKQDHHYKAGALNVLARVSAVMTNAPIILNVDCDMFVNNPQVVLHAMCLLLGFDDETCSGFVQVPQRFYGKLKDDPFGNQLDVLREILFSGLAGLQGIFYVGTGCFHRRKVIYGEAPASVEVVKHEREGSASYEDLRTKFGDSIQLVESARNIFSGDIPTTQPMIDISSRAQEAREVATCNYEIGTHWGQEIGWSYGSVAEDILTGQRIHSAGWKSTTLDTNPPAFLGCAPTGGPASLTQYKRWATGLLEILLGQNSPILATIFRRLQFRQCLAYLVFYVWSVKAPFELCYALLGPYCLLTNHSFLYKASNHGFIIQLALFLTYNIYNYVEYMECGLSARACWNNQRMQRIISASSFILAFLSVPLKTIGLSKTVFEVTRKDKSKLDDDCATQEADLGRLTFDSSPVFIPVTALAILNIVAISIGAWRHAIVWRATGNHDCPNIAEFVCCGWLVLYFWPLTRGLVGRGRYGIPWSVKLKACVIVVTFLHLCGRN